MITDVKSLMSVPSIEFNSVASDACTGLVMDFDNDVFSILLCKTTKAIPEVQNVMAAPWPLGFSSHRKTIFLV